MKFEHIHVMGRGAPISKGSVGPYHVRLKDFSVSMRISSKTDLQELDKFVGRAIALGREELQAELRGLLDVPSHSDLCEVRDGSNT